MYLARRRAPPPDLGCAGGGVRPPATGPHGPGSPGVQVLGLHVCLLPGLPPESAQGPCARLRHICGCGEPESQCVVGLHERLRTLGASGLVGP